MCIQSYYRNYLNTVGVISAAALTTMKASQVAKLQGDVPAQSALIQQVAEYWGLNGDLDKYGETIAKAAKEVSWCFSTPENDMNINKHTYIYAYIHTYMRHIL